MIQLLPLLIIPAVVTFVLILRWDLIVDHRKWEKNKTTRHKIEWLQRVALCLLPFALFTFAHNDHRVLAATSSFLMMAFQWWLWFDGLGNRKKKRTFWDNGANDDPTEKDNSTLDAFLEHIGDRGEKWLKVGGSVVFTLLYFALYGL